MANWSELPNEIKFMIISYLDYSTRQSLKQCSKLNKEVVERVPIFFGKLVVRHNDSESSFEVTIDDNLKYKIHFEQRGTGTFITRVFHCTSRRMGFNVFSTRDRFDDPKVVPNSDSGKTAIDFLNTNFKNIRFLEVVLQLSTSSVTIIPESIHAERVEIQSSSDAGMAWLSRFKPCLTHIEFLTNVDSARIWDLAQVQLCRKVLIIRGNCGINDDQLLDLKASQYLEIHSSKLTSKGLNQFFKKCMVSSPNLRFRIEIDTQELKKLMNREFMLDGLNIETRKLNLEKPNMFQKRPSNAESREFKIINGKIAIRILNDTTILGDCGAGDSEVDMLRMGKFLWEKQPVTKKKR